MLQTTDIIYFIIIFIQSYFTFFFLILWFENRGNNGKGKPIKTRELPSVSILIPAFNEEQVIGKVLENIKSINYPKNKFQVIVIDDGSKDKTYEIAKMHESKNIRILTKKNTGKASSLNYGLRFVKTEFIAVMDADTFLDKNALRNCMKYFDEKNVAAVTSHILVKRKQKIWEKIQNIDQMLVSINRKAQEKLNLINATPGPLSVYKTKVLLDVGKFDDKNLVEDVEIAWRLLKNGYKIKMAFDAMVYSIYPDNFRTWWKQRVRWYIGGVQTFLKYVDCFFRREYFSVGCFLIPTSFLNYLFTFITIGIFFYLSLNWLNANIFFFINSYSLGVNPMNRMDFSFIIDLRFVYGLMMFALSLFLLKLALSAHKEKPHFFDIILFMIVYAVLFPLINLYSLYKYSRNERGWLTK